MPTTIEFTDETRKRITLENYTELGGTKKENILCALLVNLGTKNLPITAENFLKIYNWFVTTLYQGIQINTTVHPCMNGAKLYDDARSLEGDESENLISRESCIKIASIISNNNTAFVSELDSCYTDWEVRLLLFSFSPQCAI